MNQLNVANQSALRDWFSVVQMLPRSEETLVNLSIGEPPLWVHSVLWRLHTGRGLTSCGRPQLRLNYLMPHASEW